jgi:hypothetical protein
MQFSIEVADVETPPNTSTSSNDIYLFTTFPADLVERQAEDVDIDSSPETHSQDLGGSLDFRHMLGSSFHSLSIPDELKFIMQYRQSEHCYES